MNWFVFIELDCQFMACVACVCVWLHCCFDTNLISELWHHIEFMFDRRAFEDDLLTNCNLRFLSNLDHRLRLHHFNSFSGLLLFLINYDLFLSLSLPLWFWPIHTAKLFFWQLVWKLDSIIHTQKLRAVSEGQSIVLVWLLISLLMLCFDSKQVDFDRFIRLFVSFDFPTELLIMFLSVRSDLVQYSCRAFINCNYYPD